ncbi:hypothetical protein BDR26DRAFT_940202 [Obelidium mucronatum]|nr:hypothetical protein BDR26DRAFT_940202 [Obelidium mucronatum]
MNNHAQIMQNRKEALANSKRIHALALINPSDAGSTAAAALGPLKTTASGIATREPTGLSIVGRAGLLSSENIPNLSIPRPRIVEILRETTPNTQNDSTDPSSSSEHLLEEPLMELPLDQTRIDQNAENPFCDDAEIAQPCLLAARQYERSYKIKTQEAKEEQVKLAFLCSYACLVSDQYDSETRATTDTKYIAFQKMCRKAVKLTGQPVNSNSEAKFRQVVTAGVAIAKTRWFATNYLDGKQVKEMEPADFPSLLLKAFKDFMPKPSIHPVAEISSELKAACVLDAVTTTSLCRLIEVNKRGSKKGSTSVLEETITDGAEEEGNDNNQGRYFRDAEDYYCPEPEDGEILWPVTRDRSPTPPPPTPDQPTSADINPIPSVQQNPPSATSPPPSTSPLPATSPPQSAPAPPSPPPPAPSPPPPPTATSPSAVSPPSTAPPQSNNPASTDSAPPTETATAESPKNDTTKTAKDVPPAAAPSTKPKPARGTKRHNYSPSPRVRKSRTRPREIKVPQQAVKPDPDLLIAKNKRFFIDAFEGTFDSNEDDDDCVIIEHTVEPVFVKSEFYDAASMFLKYGHLSMEEFRRFDLLIVLCVSDLVLAKPLSKEFVSDSSDHEEDNNSDEGSIVVEMDEPEDCATAAEANLEVTEAIREQEEDDPNAPEDTTMAEAESVEELESVDGFENLLGQVVVVDGDSGPGTGSDGAPEESVAANNNEEAGLDISQHLVGGGIQLGGLGELGTLAGKGVEPQAKQAGVENPGEKLLESDDYFDWDASSPHLPSTAPQPNSGEE